MQTFIEIEKLQVQAFHGVLPQEHTVGNLYCIDCILDVDFQRAMQSDELDDTVSYADVVELIKQEMAKPSQLLEHVAGRIVDRIQDRWTGQIKHINLRIAKQNPPIPNADLKACAVRVVI